MNLLKSIFIVVLSNRDDPSGDRHRNLRRRRNLPLSDLRQVGGHLPKEHGVEINHQSIGSGGGIKQIEWRTVTFGATDAPLVGADLESASRSFPWLWAASCPW